MSAPSPGWRVSWCDYRAWRSQRADEPHPPISQLDYPDRDAAREALRARRAEGLTACITRSPGPRTYHRRAKLFTDEVRST